MTGIIAIDFGTARTKVAYRHPHRGTIELARLGKDERPYIPSLFYLGADGRRLFGDDAAEYLDSDPLGFLPRPLKRELREPWVRAGNRVKATPTELLTLLFQGLRQRAGEIAGFHHAPPDRLVLTIPAQYGPPDKDILTAAARNAGFRDDGIGFVDEPIAAAQAWLAEQAVPDEYIVVLDCGGGTIDWACLRRTGADQFAMVPDLPAGGDSRVGGFDIDEALFAYLDDALPDEASRDALHAARSQILDQIRALKEKHSRTGLGGKIRVDRAVIDIPPQVIDDIIERRFISQTCQNICSYVAKVRDKLRIDAPTVLLVGGSSRIRGFKDAIEQQARCRAVWWERSEYATVLGALQPHSQAARSSAPDPAGMPRAPQSVEAFIAMQRQRHADFGWFLHDILLHLWRMSNGAWGTATNLAFALQAIEDGERGKAVSLKVRQAFERSALHAFDDMVSQTSALLANTMFERIENLPREYIRYALRLEPFRDKFALPSPWKEAIVSDMRQALQRLGNQYQAAIACVEYLVAHYPRFDAIVSPLARCDILEGVDLTAAAVTWEDWHAMDDAAFARNYALALQACLGLCLECHAQGERQLEPHLHRLVDAWQEAFQPLSEMYQALAQGGKDLEQIERQVWALAAQRDDEAHHASYHRFMASVVASVKERPGLSAASLANIIQVLRSQGCLLTPDGALDEAAVDALPIDEETARQQQCVSEAMAILQRSPCAAWERFHWLAPQIPEDQLINALHAYGFGCDANEVLALYDDSEAGDGEDGFLITLHGLHWVGPNAKRWADISTIAAAPDNDAVMIDDAPIPVWTAQSGSSLEELAALLTQLHACFVRWLAPSPSA